MRNQLKKYLSLCLLLSLVALLTSCGFALRGSTSVTLAPELQTLQLRSSNARNSELLQIASRSLRQNNVTIINDSKEGTYQLKLGEEQFFEQVISVDSSARAGEYELTLSVSIQLTVDSTEVLAPEILTTQSIYLADPNNATAKNEEARLIKNEMRQALINQLLRRLQSLSL